MELLNGKVEDVVREEDVVKGKAAWNQGTTVFKVEANAFQYTPARGIYHSEALEKHFKHMLLNVLFSFGRKVYQQVRS